MKLSQKILAGNFKFPKDLQINDVRPLPEKIIQFGEGNFLRAFVDWMVDKLNEHAHFNGRVVVVQPIPDGLVHVLNEQDGMYTLLLRGVEDGRVVEKKRLVTAISRGLDPHTDWKGYLACAENPDLRIMVSNTTEAGIAHEKEALIEGHPPASFPGKLTAFMYHRFSYFDGDPEKGLLLFPCELIDQNGSRLKEIVLRLIEEWGLSVDFKRWIETHNYFFNTLVDRIVPGYPRDDVERLTAALGYEDRLLDAGEIFHLWVIEGKDRFRTEFPLDQIGLNVVWTDDMTPYRERKVRVLNGAHTMTVAVAYLHGLDTVKEAVEDRRVGAFMRRGIFDEILPMLQLPEAEKKAFAESVLERFQNPFVHHRWLDISLNSISKFKTRCLPTILDHAQATGSPPALLSFSLAALLAFYRGERLIDGKLEASRARGNYLLSDDHRTLEFFLTCWQAHSEGQMSNCREMVEKMLGNTDLWGMDLNTVPGFCDAVAEALHRILTLGMPGALEKQLA